MVHNEIGLVHLISSFAALFLGTWVLAVTKGTRLHKQLGYAYVVSMVVVNITAFSIYRLFNGFGPFHIAAIVGSATLLAGMIPVVFRKHFPKWKRFHVAFMYYSVIGLYAAFVSEVVVRIPGVSFGWMVFVATLTVMIPAVIFFKRNSERWIN